jgi:hypothetical protein
MKFYLLDAQEEHIDAVVISLPPKPKFKIGDKVKALAFVNCFGKQVEEVSGLTVTRVTQDGGVSMPIYFRVQAETSEPYAKTRLVEGAERFFELETV